MAGCEATNVEAAKALKQPLAFSDSVRPLCCFGCLRLELLTEDQLLRALDTTYSTQKQR